MSKKIHCRKDFLPFGDSGCFGFVCGGNFETVLTLQQPRSAYLGLPSLAFEVSPCQPGRLVAQSFLEADASLTLLNCTSWFLHPPELVLCWFPLNQLVENLSGMPDRTHSKEGVPPL